MNGIRVGAAVTWACGAYRDNFLAFLALAVVVTVLQFGQQAAIAPFTESLTRCLDLGLNPEAATINQDAFAQCLSQEMSTLVVVLFASLFFVIASFLATVGVVRGSLEVTKGMRIGFAETFVGPHFLAFAGSVVLIMVFFVLGLFLFIVPALIAVLLFQFAPFYALDRGYSPFLALKSSALLVRKNASVAILVFLINAFAYLISGLFWGIPTLIALPIAALVSAHVYRNAEGERIGAPE